MPYIPDDKRRAALAAALEGLTSTRRFTPGELTYMLFYLTRYVLEQDSPEPPYAWRTQVLGCLDSLKDEYQERFLRPYEVEKLVDNGDVLPRRGLPRSEPITDERVFPYYRPLNPLNPIEYQPCGFAGCKLRKDHGGWHKS